MKKKKTFRLYLRQLFYPHFYYPQKNRKDEEELRRKLRRIIETKGKETNNF
jgi:hypothetical protein